MSRCAALMVILAWVLWIENEVTWIGTGRPPFTEWTRGVATATQAECYTVLNLTLAKVHETAEAQMADMPELKDLQATKSREVKKTLSGAIWIFKTEALTVFKRTEMSCWPDNVDPRR